MQLYNERGTALTDHSGVTVSVLDAPAVMATTAADGSFSLPDVDLTTSRRLTLTKSGYGTYLTDELTTTSPTYSLPRPVRMGQRVSGTNYKVTYKADKAGQYLVVTGVRRETGATDTRQLTHRVFFDFAIIGSSAYVVTSKYSKSFQNNQATGFSDTLRYATLRAAGLAASSFIAVGTDNPAADSCDIRYQLYNPGATTATPYSIKQGYPAVGSIDNGGYSHEGIVWDK